jgi:hypothetical protein
MFSDADSLSNSQCQAGIYFQKDYNDTMWTFKSRSKGTTVSRHMNKSFISKNNMGFTNFKFVWSDTNLVTPFINGIVDSSIKTYLPFDSLLTPSFEVWSDTISIQSVEVRQLK